jgi:hypothetical protein
VLRVNHVRTLTTGAWSNMLPRLHTITISPSPQSIDHKSVSATEYMRMFWLLGRIPLSLWGGRSDSCVGEGDHSAASAALAAVVGARRCGTCPPAHLRQ